VPLALASFFFLFLFIIFISTTRRCSHSIAISSQEPLAAQAPHCLGTREVNAVGSLAHKPRRMAMRQWSSASMN
jgi:hypothetical protein